MRTYFKYIKTELEQAISKCDNKSMLSRLLGYPNLYIDRLYQNYKRTDKSTVSSEFVSKVREFNSSNRVIDTNYVEIDEEIRAKLTEAYSYFPSYRGVCKRVLGYARPNSYTYKKFFNGDATRIHKRYVTNLDKFLEVERKRAIS